MTAKSDPYFFSGRVSCDVLEYVMCGYCCFVQTFDPFSSAGFCQPKCQRCGIAMESISMSIEVATPQLKAMAAEWLTCFLVPSGADQESLLTVGRQRFAPVLLMEIADLIGVQRLPTMSGGAWWKLPADHPMLISEHVHGR